VFVCMWHVLLSFCTELYTAVYTYTSDEVGDLTFTEGDVISVVKADGDWWTGSIGQRSGIFPGNFVKKYEERQVAAAAPVEEVELAFISILSHLHEYIGWVAFIVIGLLDFEIQNVADICANEAAVSVCISASCVASCL